jgi:DNA-binding Xre family transcriptional regulator
MTRGSPQSIPAIPEGIQRANVALKKVCSGKKTILADFAEVSRSRVQDFFAGKPIGIATFQAICKALEIEDWQNVAGLTEPVKCQLEKKIQESDLDINALVQEVRETIKTDIQERCGTMRVLDMTQPIALGEIYTSVNILENNHGAQRVRTLRTDAGHFSRDI